MEIIEIVGTRLVNFTDDNGKTIQGTSFYFLMDGENVTGKIAGKLFVSSDRLRKMEVTPMVGQKVAVSYDRYGKPTEFRVIG